MNPRQISNLAVPSFSHFSPSSPPKKRVYYEMNTVFIISSHIKNHNPADTGGVNSS